MALVAVDLLVAVVAVFATHRGGLDALRVDAAGAGGFRAGGLGADLAAQGVEDLLPGAVLLPGDEVIPHGTFGQQVVRQVIPLHAGPRLVEQGVDHLAHSDRARSAAVLGGRDQGLDEFPLGIGQIGAIWLPHGQGPAVGSSDATPSLALFLRTADVYG